VIVQSLGARIRERRLELGLTLRGSALAAAMSPAYLADIESGHRMPGPGVLGRLAMVIDLPLAELRALDPRVTPEVREWMESDPRVSTFLEALRARPDRNAWLESLLEER
jgi:transcriptional regulator with XRE-family HTH domain